MQQEGQEVAMREVPAKENTSRTVEAIHSAIGTSNKKTT